MKGLSFNKPLRRETCLETTENRNLNNTIHDEHLRSGGSLMPKFHSNFQTPRTADTASVAYKNLEGCVIQTSHNGALHSAGIINGVSLFSPLTESDIFQLSLLGGAQDTLKFPSI
jgi:hypothetical protein